MNAEDVLKFVAAAAVTLTAVLALALYENAKGVAFDQADLANVAVFIGAIVALAALLLATPEKS